MTALPSSIPEYLRQLRHELRDADPAMLQDALYDAEEYLRSALAEQPGRPETEVLAEIASSYGAPAEVADIYRTTEVTVSRALRPPRPPAQPGLLKAFFGVAADSRAYAGLFYMLLSLATGIIYFSWTVTGVSLSIGLSILIIGIPFVILFLGTTRLLSLVEGRIVEVMLGERMPRRPTYTDREQPLLTRIGAMFKDPRTWSTLLYLILMLPLGVVYFVIAVSFLSLGVGLVVGSIAQLFHVSGVVTWNDVEFGMPAIFAPVTMLIGVVVLFLTLHIARGVAKLHGALAKQLLVKAD